MFEHCAYWDTYISFILRVAYELKGYTSLQFFFLTTGWKMPVGSRVEKSDWGGPCGNPLPTNLYQLWHKDVEYRHCLLLTPESWVGSWSMLSHGWRYCSEKHGLCWVTVLAVASADDHWAALPQQPTGIVAHWPSSPRDVFTVSTHKWISRSRGLQSVWPTTLTSFCSWSRRWHHREQEGFQICEKFWMWHIPFKDPG